MPTYAYQDASVLTQIANDLILNPTMDDPIFKDFPVRSREALNLRWWIKDNYYGLMKLRGLGGEPTPVAKVGKRVFETQAGVFGEYETIDEKEMTTRAAGWGAANPNAVIDVKDLVAEAQAQLVARQINRMRQMAWTLALTGAIGVALPGGSIGYSESYTPQTVAPGTLWSTTATATPLVDLQSLQFTFGRGTSNGFMGTAEMWMNGLTADYLIRNRNANDLGGSRLANGATFNTVEDINGILRGQNVPKINVFEDGYLDDSGTFQLFIPNGKILVVASRPDGETPGETQICINAVNPDRGARAYSEVLDYTSGPARTIPPRIEVHQGFNGGTVVQRATQMVIMTVA